VNTAGPDFEVPLPAARAAIAAGTDYCDIGADGPMTEEVLKLDTAARAAGVAVIPGIGVAPGLTNLMAMHAAHQLEEVMEIQFGYLYPAEPAARELRETGHVSASWETILRYGSGDVRTYRDGQWIDVNPADSEIEVVLPQTGMVVTAYPVATAEPVTLSCSLPSLRRVESLFGLLPQRLNQMYREQAGRIAKGQVNACDAARSLLEAVADDAEHSPTAAGGSPSVPIWLTAVGLKDGRRARYSCWPTSWWMSTAGAIAAAALAVLRGDVKKSGVLPPETCFEPMVFFSEVARLGPEVPLDGKFLGESFEELE
jgi:saccharopine dehydrogenase-like NADP-dependent oxidoreductase